MRIVIEVALIAMARKVIAALILALGVAFYFERQAKREPITN